MEKIYLWVDDGEQSVKAQELLHKLGHTPTYKDRVPPYSYARHYIRCDSYGDIYYGSDADNLNKYGMGYREVTLSGLESMVKEKEMSKLRTKEDYRKMKPTDMIDVVVDGYQFEVELKSLVLLTNVLGNSTRNSLLPIWVHLDKIFGSRNSEKSEYNLEVLVADVSGYFIPEDTVKKLNEIESINETIKELK